jgi:FAD/FMN-containing dehydrogenase
VTQLSVSQGAALGKIVGERNVLLGPEATGYETDWTGRFSGPSRGVVRPSNAREVAAILDICRREGIPVIPQGGNTGLVGGGVPLAHELILSLRRLTWLSAVDEVSGQVTVGAGVTLQEVSRAHPEFELGVKIASEGSATVGGAIATNAGGVRVLRYGHMRKQIRGIEAALTNGHIISHLSGLEKDNTGYDYPSLLCGSEGTLGVVTAARLQLVPRVKERTVVVVGFDRASDLQRVAIAAARGFDALLSAEFFTDDGIAVLVAKGDLKNPLSFSSRYYLLLETRGEETSEDLGALLDIYPTVVGQNSRERTALWSLRERHPEVAGYLGQPLKLDVSVPADQWVRLAEGVEAIVQGVDEQADVILFGHVADGNVHVNIVPHSEADGRHQDAVFRFVASLGGSISAEHGIGVLKAKWLGLCRTRHEIELFGEIRRSFDPAGILNPNIF